MWILFIVSTFAAFALCLKEGLQRLAEIRAMEKRLQQEDAKRRRLDIKRIR
jgi:hypothetical protein